MQERKEEYDIGEYFEFRDIFPSEAGQAARIEEICFPPNEACSEKMMLERVAKAPELFLVAVDRETGKIAGFLNGLSTEEVKFRDEFFVDAELYDPVGRNVMLLGLDVLPEYRRRGLAREIMSRYLHRERERGRKEVFLTCLDSKVEMYKRMGFQDHGMSESAWGGEQWHEMSCVLNSVMEIHFDRMQEAIPVMREVAAWGRSKEYQVWPEEWLTAEELITRDAQPENFCIGTIDGETVCAFILQWADSQYWPHAPEGEAAYLHKLCVRRNFAGQGMTETVVAAIRKECRSRGIRYIRLDTALDEKVVRKIYLNAGFKIVDILDYPNGRSLALYEMEV